jgi:hypothetical protein
MEARNIAVLAILLVAMAPTATADPYGIDCSDPSTYDTVTYDDVQCLTIAGPGSLSHKSLLGAGLGVCTTDAGSPIPCNDPGAPQSGFGAAIFDSSTWSSGVSTVRTWVEFIGACVGPPETCGFDVLLCNDRDYDGICTNISAQNDELFSTQSNEPLIHGGTLDPDYDHCADGDKDDKNCEDDLDASVAACMNPAMQPPAPADWNYGQVVVFIGNWVDSWPGAIDPLTTGYVNVGAGISAGHYDVWLAQEVGCTIPPGEPPLCWSSLTLATRLVAIPPAAVAINCAGATCAVAGLAVPTTTVTVTCTVADGCDAHLVKAVASLDISIAGDEATAEVFCDGVSVTGMAHAVNPVPLFDATPFARKPATGDYECKMTFTVVAAPALVNPPYRARAYCYDP